jgi:hypothetical protein
VTSTEGISTDMLEAGGQRHRTPIEPRCVLYGLPCADCRAYYPANLEACPICRSVKRVSPNTKPFTLGKAQAKKAS